MIPDPLKPNPFPDVPDFLPDPDWEDNEEDED